MQAPGLAAIEAGKAAGLWDFYADVDALIPQDLADAFDGPGRENFDAFARRPSGLPCAGLSWRKRQKPGQAD